MFLTLTKGCDMRNISRVVLWGLPPSFCALVQRAGRAARDFQMLGEAILIVSSNCIEEGNNGGRRTSWSQRNDCKWTI